MYKNSKITKYILTILLFLTAFFMLAACKSEEPEEDDFATEPPAADEIPITPETFTFTPEDFPRIDGVPATAPMAQALAAAMLGMSRNDVKDRVMFTGSAQAFRNLAAGNCDIILTGEPQPFILDDISRQDFRYDMAPIAADALVFIVSRSNPVDNLTSQQIRDIYSGKITQWQDAGGNDLDIIAYQRNEEATSHVMMEKLVMDWSPMADAPMQPILSSNLLYSDDSLPSAVKGFDGGVNAIGYTTYYYAVQMEMATGYKILSVDGIQPTNETIAGGVYPYINPYYAVVSKDLPEDDNSRILYNWLLSDEGQDFIASQGYVPVSSLQAQDDIQRVPASPMRWDVITDSSNLTPYIPPHSATNRLYDAAMPMLEPSDSYGILLPYCTSITMNDGSIYPAKYGFVTASSKTIVTDPIYDSVDRITYVSSSGVTPKPAYRLHLNLPENDPEFGFSTIQAACALDGSWITPFIYTNIVFRDNIIFCMYDYETFDIDVYDYHGNLLYNILKDTDWAERIAEDAWPDYLVYGEGDNIGFILFGDSTYAVIDLATGDITETDFTGAFMFSEGLACVIPGGGNDLWGFVDESLEIVIEPEFTREAIFINGYAVAETPDGIWHIISKQGEKVYSAGQDYIISTLHDNYGYRVFSLADTSQYLYLDSSLTEIEYPEQMLPLGPDDYVSYMHKGWFMCETESGIWFFNKYAANDNESAYLLPSFAGNILDFYDDAVIFAGYDFDTGNRPVGAMTIDGQIVIPALDSHTISLHYLSESRWFAVNTNISGTDAPNFIGDSFTQARYSLYSLHTQAQGSAEPAVHELRSGIGILAYDSAAASGNFYIIGTDYFTWIDSYGETLISIPSMGYSFD